MKINFLWVIFICLSIVACHPDSSRGGEALRHINKSNSSVIGEKGITLTNFLGVITEIQKNLDSINTQERIINARIEHSENDKRIAIIEMNEHIKKINKILSVNNKIVVDINDRLKSSPRKNEELKKVIMALNDKLSAKELALMILKTLLNKFEPEIETLETTVGILYYEYDKSAEIIVDRGLNSSVDFTDRCLMCHPADGECVSVVAGKTIRINDLSRFKKKCRVQPISIGMLTLSKTGGMIHSWTIQVPRNIFRAQVILKKQNAF